MAGIILMKTKTKIIVYKLRCKFFFYTHILCTSNKHTQEIIKTLNINSLPVILVINAFLR